VHYGKATNAQNQESYQQHDRQDGHGRLIGLIETRLRHNCSVIESAATFAVSANIPRRRAAGKSDGNSAFSAALCLAVFPPPLEPLVARLPFEVVLLFQQFGMKLYDLLHRAPE
jgi:hypothetical protein